MNADPNGEMPPFEAIDDVTIPIDRPPRRRARQNLVDLTHIDRLPPHDIPSEQGALGCILLDSPTAIPICQAKLTELSFYDLRHQTLYHHLLKLADSGSPIDIITVSNALRAASQLEAIGGIAYLSALQDATPSASNISYYADILDEKTTQRRLLAAATKIVAQIYEPTEASHEAQLESAKNLFDAALQPVRYRFGAIRSPIESDVDLETRNPVAGPQLIQGLIRQRGKVVIGGQSKARKSWLAMDAAISVSHGVRFLGLQTRQAKVLYINLELEDCDIKDRYRYICHARNLPLRTPPQLFFWNLRDEIVNAHALRSSLKRQTAGLTGENFGLIIIDPFYKLASGLDENAAGEMTKLMGEIHGIIADTGAAILMPAHFAKGNSAAKESIDRISGSGVIGRDPDGILTLTRLDEGEDTLVLEASIRAMPPFAPMALRWQFPLFVPDQSLDPTNYHQPRKPGRPQVASAANVMDILPPSGLTRSRWRDLIVERLKLKKTVAYEAIANALADGLAIQSLDRRCVPSDETIAKRRKNAVANAPVSGYSGNSGNLFPESGP